MKQLLLLIIMALGAAGCKMNQRDAFQLTPIASPAASPSAEPFLFTDTTGTVYLSWLEQKDSTHVFKYTTLNAENWNTPHVISESGSWFVNWADYPMVATHDGNQMLALVLNRSGEGTYAYDVKMFAAAGKEAGWDHSFILHDDGKQAEHGFVSMTPYGKNIFVAWLDGRNTVMEGMENMEGHGGHHGAMSLRGAIIDYKGNKINEWELDNKTCDCCQTAAAITDNGPVVVYRDRSNDEIRDISITRKVNEVWTPPQSVYADNWKIAGCPVNGPRISAIGNTLAIAWFGLVDNKPQVKVIFSRNGGETFDTPFRIDEGQAIGRVDVEMLDSERAMVSWMEGTKIKAVLVNTDGEKSDSIEVANSSEARSSGFPQMTRNGNDLIFAWTDDSEKKVKTARLKL